MKNESVKKQFIKKIDEFVKVKNESGSDPSTEHLIIGALEQDLRLIGQEYSKTSFVIELINLIPNGLAPSEIKRIISIL